MSTESTNVISARIKRKTTSVLILIVLILAAAFALFPIYMCILNSVKTQGEMMNNIMAFPTHIEFDNYINAFQKIRFFQCLVNTIIIVAIGLTGITLFASMAGYKLCRTKTKLSGLILTFFLMSMLIPFSSIMITLYKVAITLNADDSIVGLGMIYIGLGVSMAIFLYHGFVKSIPVELEEAAVMDGCGEFKLFFTIIFPLLNPITATIIILNALWMWNDFLLPLLMLSDFDQYTILISTSVLFGEFGNNQWTKIMAALTMEMIPAIFLYMVLQKYIMKGISEGAVKG